VIGKGKLIADCSTREFISRRSEKSVLVRSPDAGRLADLIAAEGGKALAQQPSDGQAAALTVTGLEAPRIGEIAAGNRIVLHELTPQLASLEEAFLELTAGSVEYGAGEMPAAGAPAPAGPTAPGSGPGPPSALPPPPHPPSRRPRALPRRPPTGRASACCWPSGRRSGRSGPRCGRWSSSPSSAWG